MGRRSLILGVGYLPLRRVVFRRALLKNQVMYLVSSDAQTVNLRLGVSPLPSSGFQFDLAKRQVAPKRLKGGLAGLSVSIR
jgi:hypothetical protein